MINNITDQSRFMNARLAALGEDYERTSIGTYGEKMLHRILKYYFEPNDEYHEVKFLGSVADIKRDGEVFEIQTRNLKALKPKLKKFLKEIPVTVIYPLPNIKYIRWIDRETGDISKRRKSPKVSSVFDAVYELYNLREFLRDKNFSVKLVFLNIDEFKYKNADAFGRNFRIVRAERIPISIEKIIDLKSSEDYRIFIPEGLPEEFTANFFSKTVSSKYRYGYSAIKILEKASVAKKVKVVGRKTIYKIK